MTPRFKTLIAAALACAALTALIPSSASAAKGLEVAVQDDSALVVQLPRPGYRAKALKLAEGLKTSWIRANVAWSYVVNRQKRKKKQPKNIEYNWSGYDALIQDANARGINVQLALTGTAPAWATGNHKVGNYKVKARPFKVFAHDAAVHFHGKVTRMSIWNEPNYVSWLSPLKKAPRLYRSLYAAGYSGIKRADENVDVLIAETSPYGIRKRATPPLKFLRGVTCANKRYKRARKCSTLKTDGFAHHPYDFRHKPTYRYPGKDNVTLATLSRLTSALSKLRKSKLLTTPEGGVPFLYLTEYGYMSSGKYKVSRSKQGKYLVYAFNKALKNSRVKQLLQYILIKPSSRYRFFDTSIGTRKGGKTSAYNKLAKWAAGKLNAGQITGPSGG